MKIAFVSIADSSHLTPSSQHSYFLAKALRDQGVELELISPLEMHESAFLWTARKLSRLFLGRRILPNREPSIVQDLARQVERKLERSSCDIVFGHGTIPLSLLQTKKPVVFWSDATFAGMVDFYPSFSRLSARSLHYGNQFERMAIARSALAIYASEWARKTCIEAYGADPARVVFIPYGANLEAVPDAEEVRAAIRARTMRPCRLLFIGQDWERKNGAAAIRLAGELNRRGLPTVLTLFGSTPGRKGRLPPYVRVLGKINKTVEGQIRLFSETMLDTHFLVLPTLADTNPRVLNEANACGVPCIATNVGGIGSVIQDSVNGYLFPPDAAFPARAADCILQVMASEKGYRDLARGAYSMYSTTNNWTASGKKVIALLGRL